MLPFDTFDKLSAGMLRVNFLQNESFKIFLILHLLKGDAYSFSISARFRAGGRPPRPEILHPDKIGVPE